MFAALLLSVFCGAAGDVRPLDVVELAGGSKLEGRVVFEGADEIVLRVGSNERTIPRAKIARYDSRAASVREVHERWRALSADDLAGTLELARDCRKRSLEEEAQLFAWYVLGQSDSNAQAHEFLGHEKRGEGWLVRDGARQWPWKQLLELRRGWKDAWELQSEHFRLRSNLPLQESVLAALELEAAYAAFFELLGQPLRFGEIVDPLAAEVHADARSFPETAGDARSYFDHASRVLFVNAAKGFDRAAFAHEATHQLLDACMRSTRSARGSIPGWLDEGLAVYVASASAGPLGRSRAQAGQFDLARFAEHAGAREPYTLSRVLNFGPDDFFASVQSSLKYSESYTLVCWGLFGEEGRLRERFFSYLREACKGHSSSTAFKDELHMGEAEIEKSWLAFVRATAERK